MDLIEDAVAEGFWDVNFIRWTFGGDFTLGVSLFQFGHYIPLNWFTLALPGQGICFCILGSRAICDGEVKPGEKPVESLGCSEIF